jgi:alpha-glucosidase
MSRLRLALTLLAAAFAATPAWAGWESLTDFPAPAPEDGGLLFRNAQGLVSVTALGPSVVRVRFAPGKAFGRDHSYAVVNRALGDPGLSVNVGAERSTLTTTALRVTIQHAPFRVTFQTLSGEVIDQDDPELGTAFAGHRVRVWKRLGTQDHVYGLGEKTGRLDKRGWSLGGSAYAMWNSDTFGYDASTDPIYVSVPFYIVHRDGRAHGVFLDNTFRSFFDIGKESQDLISFGAEDGELDYYFIDGPDPRSVVARYTALTGRMPLPPRWALGYHQSRYSYYPESRVRLLADTFREKRVPGDVIWFDIHYLDGYAPLTWNHERFPDPKKMLSDLRGQGFRVVTIVDPHPKKEKGFAPYDSGLAGDFFVKNPDGSVYEDKVWPSAAEKNPRLSVFPDFSKKAAREWWGGLYKGYLDDGVAGFWNDMNEPAVFLDPPHTMPLDVRFDNEGAPSDQREIHNVYGLLMTRSTFEGVRKLRPNERPFVLTRASFAGGQRYAAVWPGDNVSDWSQLRASLPMLMGMGLSGFSFVGSDIGGFAETATADLYTRWLQLGVFYPFMRSHTAFGTPDQEPWSYGERHEVVNRRAIELRYELLPHVYNEMQAAAESGVPAFRPLFLEFPNDPLTYSLDDEVLFGRDLLVAPVMRDQARERELYLPAGAWYDFWTGEAVAGGRKFSVPVTLQSLPVFVREGGFVFRQPVIQHTGEMSGQPLRVFVYPAAQSEATLYEDDGESLRYQAGEFLKRRFAQARTADGVTVRVDAAQGGYRPAPRSLELHVRVTAPVRRAMLGSTVLDVRNENAFAVVTLPDRFDAFTVVLTP